MAKIADSVKNIFWPGAGKTDKPVYLQETGEMLGRISGEVRGEDGDIEAYTVESNGRELTFSTENLIEGKDGFIYQPLWLIESEKIIDKLETHQRINPEITAESSNNLNKAQLKQIFASSNPELKETVENAKEIGRFLLQKKESLKNKKDSLEIEIENKTRQRMSGENSRKEFAETIMDLKRKAKISEENLNKVERLLSRLRGSPLIDFEELKTNGKEDMAYRDQGSKMENQNVESNKSENNSPKESRKENERIKKIRIPKIEQEFEQKEARIQEAYLSDLQDRIQKINQDIEDLEDLSEEIDEDEQVKSFVDKKINNLEREKEELKEKIQEVKQDNDSLENQNEVDQELEADVEEIISEEKVEQTQDTGGSMGSMLARLGSLAFIIGLIVLLVLSLLRVF